MLVTVTEAKARLGELLREAAEEDVVVVRHGHAAAVLVGAERYDALLEELEDLEELAALVLLVCLCPEAVERWLHVGDAVSEGLRAVYGELPGAAPHA